MMRSNEPWTMMKDTSSSKRLERHRDPRIAVFIHAHECCGGSSRVWGLVILAGSSPELSIDRNLRKT